MNMHSIDSEDLWGVASDGNPEMDPPQNPSMMGNPQMQRPPVHSQAQMQRPPAHSQAQMQRPPAQLPPPQMMQGRPPPPPPPPPHMPPSYHPPASHEARPRKVHFANDRQRFSRVDDGVSVASSSWLEKNKVMVMTLSVALVLVLIVALVVVSKRKSGGAPVQQIPAFVGGGGGPSWEQSVSQVHPHYY